MKRPYKLRWVTPKELWRVFFPKKGDEFCYLGLAYYSGRREEYIIKPFFLEVEKFARPKWCPRWFLRFLHLYGNDNSVVRLRHRWANNLHRRLTKGIFIHDMKWKFESFRIYGTFSDELYKLSLKVCEQMTKDAVY